MNTFTNTFPYTNTFTSTTFSSNNNVNQSKVNNGLAVMKGNTAYLGACVAALNPSALISAAQNFASNRTLGAQTLYQTHAYGLWPGQGQKFMGVKFNIAGSAHYGWVRLSVAANCQSFTVYDYAYEDVAGRGIRAGQTEGTLSVELSAFTAQFDNNKPTLCWTTQSETDNMGWNIYRNTENNFNTALKISDFIEGQGTTTQAQSYTFEDENAELVIGLTYYYWLESIDYGGTIHHYNRCAQITIPDLNDPGQNILPPLAHDIIAEPNPFSHTTTISFVSEQTGNINISIYNLKGELLRSFDTISHTLEESVSINWDGKTETGKSMSNGIYLYSVKINGTNAATRRLILLK